MYNPLNLPLEGLGMEVTSATVLEMRDFQWLLEKLVLYWIEGDPRIQNDAS
jgi:hypothetical protein